MSWLCGTFLCEVINQNVVRVCFLNFFLSYTLFLLSWLSLILYPVLPRPLCVVDTASGIREETLPQRTGIAQEGDPGARREHLGEQVCKDFNYFQDSF